MEKEVATRSVTVKNMVDDTGLDTPVPLPMVDSKILIKVGPGPCVDRPHPLQRATIVSRMSSTHSAGHPLEWASLHRIHRALTCWQSRVPTDL